MAQNGIVVESAPMRAMYGNRTRTAKALGISLRGLQYKLRAYGTNDQDSSDSEASMGRHA